MGMDYGRIVAAMEYTATDGRRYTIAEQARNAAEIVRDVAPEVAEAIDAADLGIWSADLGYLEDLLHGWDVDAMAREILDEARRDGHRLPVMGT